MISIKVTFIHNGFFMTELVEQGDVGLLWAAYPLFYCTVSAAFKPCFVIETFRCGLLYNTKVSEVEASLTDLSSSAFVKVL